MNELALRRNIEFRIMSKNRYSALSGELYISVEAMNDNLTGIITKCAIEIGGKVFRQDSGMLSQETKDLIKKGKN